MSVMETANLPAVVRLGLKAPGQLVPTTYTVDVGPLKDSDDQLDSQSVKLEDTDFDYDIEYSTDHVPLGEILERLQAEDRAGDQQADKSNLIRLHAANDSSAATATISATLNFASLTLATTPTSSTTSVRSMMFYSASTSRTVFPPLYLKSTPSSRPLPARPPATSRAGPPRPAAS